MNNIRSESPDNQLAWQLQAPVVKYWTLPKWIPRAIRRIVHSYEPRQEETFLWFCRWVAFNRDYFFEESSLVVAADATRMAYVFGVSRMEIVMRWAYAGPEYDPDWHEDDESEGG